METAISTESFVFYKSFYEALQALDDNARLQAYDAICSYALDVSETPSVDGIAKVIFIMAKPQMDANKKRKTNGNKGGRPTTNSTKTTTKKTNGSTKNKPNVNENVNVNVNANVNENVNENANANDTQSVCSVDEYSLLFDSYPEHMRTEADKQTKLLYAKMRSAKKLPPIDELLAILKAHKKSRQWQNGYIPKMKNWLRNGMFHENLSPYLTPEEEEIAETSSALQQEIADKKRWAVANGFKESEIVFADFVKAYNEAMGVQA